MVIFLKLKLDGFYLLRFFFACFCWCMYNKTYLSRDVAGGSDITPKMRSFHLKMTLLSHFNTL